MRDGTPEKNLDHLDARLELFVEALQDVGRVDARPTLSGKGYPGQNANPIRDGRADQDGPDSYLLSPDGYAFAGCS